MRYCTSLQVKRLQKYQRSKLKVEKNPPDQPGPGCIDLKSGWVGNFLLTSNFELWYFCSLLTYKSEQYLMLMIWSISIWRLKAMAMAWLLMLFMFALISYPISYHTEAFVQTEVCCTVLWNTNLNISIVFWRRPRPALSLGRGRDQCKERVVIHLSPYIYVFFTTRLDANT